MTAQIIKISRRKAQKTTADAILAADWHVRPDVPICRTDNFFAAMCRKIDFILALSKQHDCPILISGDLGEKPQWKNSLLELMINKFIGNKIILIPGQHDLPNHRLDLWKESGIGVLHAAGAIETIGVFKTEDRVVGHRKNNFFVMPFPYGSEIESFDLKIDIPMIAMTHQMVIQEHELWPGQIAKKGHSLLKKFPEYSIILSGDNHQSFVVEYEGRKLVNPGSLMRSDADQINHQPRVYLWYAQSNVVEPIYLSIEQGVISREHIDISNARENRNKAFIERVNSDVEIKLSYTENLERYFNKFRTESKVKEKVWNACETV